ncbi:MAG: hypothetical protein ACJAZQ_003303, partial [Cognaticolwellia sp.]
MKFTKFAIVSVFFISGCGGDSEEESPCPEVT